MSDQQTNIENALLALDAQLAVSKSAVLSAANAADASAINAALDKHCALVARQSALNQMLRELRYPSPS